MNDKFAACFFGMVIVGACGVSLGFPPMVGGTIGFILGYIIYTSKNSKWLGEYNMYFIVFIIIFLILIYIFQELGFYDD